MSLIYGSLKNSETDVYTAAFWQGGWSLLMPHVKVSMLPTYSRIAQLPTNQEAQQVPDNRGHVWKFKHGEWIVLNSRLTSNFESNLQYQQQMLQTVLEGVWQTHNVRVNGIWLVLRGQSWIWISGEQRVQLPACNEQGQSATGAEDCALYHMALTIAKVSTVSNATNDCISVYCII